MQRRCNPRYNQTRSSAYKTSHPIAKGEWMIDDHKMGVGKGESKETDQIPFPPVFCRKSGQKDVGKQDKCEENKARLRL